MRTTIHLPDELFRQAKARAALDGTTLKSLITRFVELGLRGASPPEGGQRSPRSEPPVARPATGRPIPALSNEEMDRLLLAEEVARESGA